MISALPVTTARECVKLICTTEIQQDRLETPNTPPGHQETTQYNVGDGIEQVPALNIAQDCITGLSPRLQVRCTMYDTACYNNITV